MPFEFWQENFAPFGFMLTTSMAEIKFRLLLGFFKFCRENLSPGFDEFRFPSVLVFFEPDWELEDREEETFNLNILELFLILFITVFFSPKTKNMIIP